MLHYHYHFCNAFFFFGNAHLQNHALILVPFLEKRKYKIAIIRGNHWWYFSKANFPRNNNKSMMVK